jgi:hypothetical protein
LAGPAFESMMIKLKPLLAKRLLEARHPVWPAWIAWNGLGWLGLSRVGFRLDGLKLIYLNPVTG